jgi:DNA-binding GntR family transcriptional regulator
VINWLWARIGPYLSIQVSKTEDLSGVMEYHRRMCDAFAKRDAREMVHFLRKDLKEAALFIVKVLESHEQE